MVVRRDVVGAQAVLADLLAHAPARRAWLADPTGYARSRLTGHDEIAMIARLPPSAICAAALQQDLKRITAAAARTTLPAGRDAPATGPGCSRERPAAPTGPDPLDAGRPLVGLGYWPELFGRLSGEPGLVEVWEHTVDDYLGDGPSLRALAALADSGPVVLHSLGLSVGSAEATADAQILDALRAVVRAAHATELSDHLAFTRAGGRSLGHFAPIWRVPEALELTAANVDRIQHELGVRLVLENVAPEFDPGGELGTAQFLGELVARTGCGVLLDITNLTLSEANGFCDADAELAALDLDAVCGVHLAGGVEQDGRFLDAHAFPVAEADLERLRRLLPALPHCTSVVIERDDRREALTEITADLRRLRAVLTDPAGVRPAVPGRARTA